MTIRPRLRILVALCFSAWAAMGNAAGPATPVAPSPAEETAVDAARTAMHEVPTRGAALPLGPMPLSAPDAVGAGVSAGAPSRGNTADWWSLAALAAAFAVAALVTSMARRRTTGLPPDVFEVLGTAPLGGPHAVRVVRFGPKALLVAVSSSGCRTLAELTDPQATECVAAACRGAFPALRPGSARSADRSQRPGPVRVRAGGDS